MKKSLLISWIFIGSFLLSGCGSTSWYLNGKSSQQFKADSLVCQTLTAQYYGGPQNIIIGDKYYDTCMESRGYTIAL